MSEVSYVENLAAQAASFMISTELVARARAWRVVNIPVAVDEIIGIEHARSFEDPDIMLMLRERGSYLGFNPDSIRNAAWLGFSFCDGYDAHGPGGKMLWCQIAAATQYHLRWDAQYEQLRELNDLRGRTRNEILHRQAMKFAPP